MKVFLAILLFCGASVLAAEVSVPSGWRHSQEMKIEKPGFTKIALPPETMTASRPRLEDLRLFGSNGKEVPYVLEFPGPSTPVIIEVAAVTSSISESNTTFQIETGVTATIEALLLDSPAETFFKPVTVEGLDPAGQWKMLAQSKPVFRLANGSAGLIVSLPGGVYKSLRVQVDDTRSGPIPFTNIRVQSVPENPNPEHSIAVEQFERQELRGESRIHVSLGAANLYVSEVELHTSEPFYTRMVSILVPTMQENQVVERKIASGRISRIRLDGSISSENRTIRLEQQIPSDSLTIVLANGDSPPIPVKQITVRYRSVNAGFYAEQPATYLIASGNQQVPPARYDLRLSADYLAQVKITDVKIGPLTTNPNYREPELLPGIAESGARIDLKDWKFRKTLQLTGAGIHQAELDLETLSLSASGLQDLRVVQNESQLPYLLERTSGSREIALQFNSATDPNRPTVSRWEITLPHKGMPLTQVLVDVPNPLFQRTVYLYEAANGVRGGVGQRFLGQATWTRQPGQGSGTFSVDVQGTPQSEHLVLETDNGDNPPIAIQNVRASYPIVKVLFKANAEPVSYLYFGNEKARSPQYDLAIVGEQILRSEKGPAGLGRLEILQPGLNYSFSGRGTSILFWGVLVLVVVGLLLLISRLLPNTRPL